jgi:hypothetical protein
VTRLDDLRELRGQLREWMVDAPADRKAALVAQYRATLAEIDDLAPPEVQGDGIDQIAARRVARRARPAKGAGGAEQSG